MIGRYALRYGKLAQHTLKQQLDALPASGVSNITCIVCIDVMCMHPACILISINKLKAKYFLSKHSNISDDFFFWLSVS